jgi:hypothetical protein
MTLPAGGLAQLITRDPLPPHRALQHTVSIQRRPSRHQPLRP